MSKTIFASNGEASGSAVERRKHILCADDHEDTRAMMMTLLEMQAIR